MLQVRGFACDCSFPKCCDSQAAPLQPTRLALKQQVMQNGCWFSSAATGGSSSSSDGADVHGSSNGVGREALPGVAADDKALRELESRHVVQVYDAIAQHFSATRCLLILKLGE